MTRVAVADATDVRLRSGVVTPWLVLDHGGLLIRASDDQVGEILGRTVQTGLWTDVQAVVDKGFTGIRTWPVYSGLVLVQPRRLRATMRSGPIRGFAEVMAAVGVEVGDDPGCAVEGLPVALLGGADRHGTYGPLSAALIQKAVTAWCGAVLGA